MRNLVLLFLLTLISCDQEYNGRYVLYECKLKNGKPCNMGDNYLQLDWNKTFILKTDKKVITGRWNFYDDGEAAILELKNYQQCGVGILNDGRRVLNFFNPQTIFDNDSINVVEFVMEQ